MSVSSFEAHEIVVRWIAAKTGLKTILARQGVARPPVPYIMVNPTGFNTLHYHASEVEYEEVTTPDGEKVLATPVMDVEWRYSIHAYSSEDREPEDILIPLKSYVQLQQPMEPMFPELVVHSISQIRNVPEMVQNTWEPRAQMDLFLHGVMRYGHLIDVIEQTEVVIERVD